MTTAVVTVAPEAAVDEIARTLIQKNISAVPVVDANQTVIGIVSEGDLLRRSENETTRRRAWWLDIFASEEDEARAYVKSHGRTAADVMSSDIVTVGEDTSVGKIAEMLEKNHIKRVPVLRDGKMVGIVSRANLLQGLASGKATGPAAPSADDRTIRDSILALLEGEGWVSHGALNVIVTNGGVELWGWVESEQERKALLVAAKSVAGVTGVEDHLGSVAPWVAGM